MNRSILLLGLLLPFVSVAQDPSRKDQRSLSDRLYFGGGIGLSFGTVTAIQVDPLVGYKVDQDGKFSVGLGGSYWYYQDNRYTPPINFTGYGYRTFSRYRVFDQFFLHAEFLHLNVERYSVLEDRIKRIWVPHVLAGAGYVQSLGGRSSIYFQILFEVLQDPNSVYRNQGPIISGGVGIGF
ncbi:MAG: hypothetical protein IPI81_16800 [Flavobacteriales bacterium]|nr:hypothetical protein [Flavobacteriales bacterium]MCC6939458.1 hypothetical protein [Flavobacteriales bacterium]